MGLVRGTGEGPGGGGPPGAPGPGELTRRGFLVGSGKLGLGLGVGGSAAAATAWLSGCRHPSHRAAAPKNLQGRVQILVGFDGGNTTPGRTVQETLARAFIAAHPQVGIDFLRAPTAAAAVTQLQILVARGSPPDIVLGVGLADISRYLDQKLWLDLRPLVERDGVATNAFVPQALAAATEANYYGGTKALPGLPLGIHDHALAYNVALFSNAGLPVPPASWSDNSWAAGTSFLQAARALTVDGSGKHPDQPGFDAGQIVQFGVGRIRPEAIYFAFGGQLYDRAQRRAQFDTPAAIEGAQFAGDLINRYHVQPTAAQTAQLAGSDATGREEQAAWRAGRVAMIDLCSCELDTDFARQVPFVWKAAALPTGPRGRFGVLEASLATIVAASQQHDLAWEVLKYLTVDAAQERQLAYGGFAAMPAVTAGLSAFRDGTESSSGVDPAVWLAGIPSSSAELDGWVPAYDQVSALFRAALATVVGGASATSVMPGLQKQAQTLIDGWFRSHKLPG